MKTKKTQKDVNKFDLNKFEIAKLKNMRLVIGGGVEDPVDTNKNGNGRGSSGDCN